VATPRPNFENRPGTDTAGLQSAVQRYVQAIGPKIDEWDEVVEQAVRSGNDVITNLDPLGAARVRVAVQLEMNPTRGTGVGETTALYIRNDHGDRWDREERFPYGIYGEQDQYQHLAGGSWSKVIHRGWGDAHFVAIMATGDQVPISDASNTTPIVITTTRKHGFGHANIYQVTGVTGNTAANSNAWYYCRVLDEYRLELWQDTTASVGNGAYTGGGQITCIDPPVGYEAAHFSEQFLASYFSDPAARAAIVDTIGRANGAVGFLSSIQAGTSPTPGTALWESGLSRNKLFEALVENDQLLSGACFIASDTPNRAFIATKRQYFTDSGAAPFGPFGSYAQFALEEAYYNPQPGATAAMIRWEVRNNADMAFHSLNADGTTTTRDSSQILLGGAYWNGAASVEHLCKFVLDVTSTAPASNLLIGFGPPAAPVTKFTLGSDGTFSATAVGATTVSAATLAASASYQGLGPASDGTTTTQDSPTFLLEGSYWNGAASVLHGVNMVYDVTATSPAGRLLMRFGTPGSETLRYVFQHDGTADWQAGKLIAVSELRTSTTNWKVGLGTADYGSGDGVIGIAVCATAPSVTPGGGGVIYVDAAGNLRYLGPGGTDTPIAPP
jgi:hypothetical protein